MPGIARLIQATSVRWRQPPERTTDLRNNNRVKRLLNQYQNMKIFRQTTKEWQAGGMPFP